MDVTVIVSHNIRYRFLRRSTVMYRQLPFLETVIGAPGGLMHFCALYPQNHRYKCWAR